MCPECRNRQALDIGGLSQRPDYSPSRTGTLVHGDEPWLDLGADISWLTIERDVSL